MECDSTFCDVCGVSLPACTRLDEHTAGKKHRYISEKRQKEEALIQRSVFLSGLDPETSAEKTIIENLSVFGAIDSVKMGAKATTAIVEFSGSSSATELLKAKKVTINGQTVAVRSRILHEQRPGSSGSKPETASGDSPYDAASNSKGEAPLEPMDAASSPIVVDNSFQTSLLSTVANSAPSNCLESQIHAVSASLGSNGAALAQKRAFIDFLKARFSSFIGTDLEVNPIGSYANGFDFQSCDLDVTLIVPPPKDDGVELNRTKYYLQHARFEEISSDITKLTPSELNEVYASDPYGCMKILSRFLMYSDVHTPLGLRIVHTKPVASKRCPLIRVTTTADWSVDVSFNNVAAERNTRFFAKVSELDGRVVVLYRLVRAWAHVRCRISREHHMSNYGLLLMVLAYMQHSKYLPSVEEIERQETPVGPGNKAVELNMKSKAPVSSLIVGFFEFYSKLTFAKVVISPAAGGKALLLSELPAAFPDDAKEFKLASLNIQDPFVLNHNVAAHVSKGIARQFEKELVRGNYICGDLQFAEILTPRCCGLEILISAELVVTDLKNPVKWSGYNIASKADPGSHLLRIFTDILGFSFSESKFSAGHKTWIGRRKFQKKASQDLGDNRDAFSSERKVTGLLLQQNPVKCDMTVRLAYNRVSVDSVFVQLFLLHSAVEQDFVDFGHFLSVFIHKFFV